MQTTRRRSDMARRPRRILACMALVVAMLGTSVFVTPEAEAWGWSRIRSHRGIQIYACKKPIVTYGPLYEVNVLIHKTPDSDVKNWGSVSVYRGGYAGDLIHQFPRKPRPLAPGQWISGRVYVSRILPDQLSVFVSQNTPSGVAGAGGFESLSRIARC